MSIARTCLPAAAALLWTGLAALFPVLAPAASASAEAHLPSPAADPGLWPSPQVAAMVANHCAACHDAEERKGKLDLEALLAQPLSLETLPLWTRVHDRVAAGEMPPRERRRRPDAEAVQTFLSALSTGLTGAEDALLAERGRSLRRRLNRYEYENSLRDLLSLPILEVRNALPEDAIAKGYNKVGEALDVSHVQLARYLQAAEDALRQAVAPSVQPPAPIRRRYHTWDQSGFVKIVGPTLRKTFPVVGHELQPALVGQHARGVTLFRPNLADYSLSGREDQEAVVMLMSTYEVAYIRFNQFKAPVAGRYRLRFSGYSVWMSPAFDRISPGRRLEPIAIYAAGEKTTRRIGSFDFGTEPTVREIEVWLHAGETIQPDAVRLVRSRPPDFKNPLLEPDGMPGVAFQWMEATGPLLDAWPPAGHRLLFGDLPIVDPETKDSPASSGQVRHVRVLSTNPAADAERLLRGFLSAAFRRPPSEAEVGDFLDIVHYALHQGFDFTDAMLAAYTGALASPGFIYLQPNPGRLDGYALAERLSYFLWNSPPDARLRALAASGELLHPDTLRAETERLLAEPRSRRFVEAFLDYWLDLREMADNSPDGNLYPEYQIDDFLMESATEEPRLYFAHLLQQDLPARTIVDANFTFLNERLARLYGIPGVLGADLRLVTLPPGHPRGGFLTQSAILKVTANGTTTSPVLRGVWINERILGLHTPPPPAGVPAIESDTRGATTIREQLALHSSQPSCAGCHVKIDPPGFALESFDVMGAWRDRYRSLGAGDPVPGIGHHGQIFTFKVAQPVDASGQLPDGRAFADIRAFKDLILQDETQLARNIVEHLSIYATGAPLRFSDRARVEAILATAQPSGYGLRSLLHALVQSDLFLRK